MRKLIALLLALVMALSCTAALAEEAAPALPVSQPMEAIVGLSVNRDFVTAYASTMDQPGTTTYADLAGKVLDIVDNLYLDGVVDMENSTGRCVALINDTPLFSLGFTADEDKLYVVSDLIPSYALSISAADVMEMAQAIYTINGQQVSQEEFQQFITGLMGAISPYIEDVMGYIGTMQDKIEMSEDGSTMTIRVTTHELADIAELLAARLSADEAMKPYVQMALDQINAERSEEEALTLEAALAQVQAKVAELKAAEPQEVAIATITNGENGMNAEVLVANNAKITVTAGGSETGMVLDVCLLSSQEGTEDWDALYAGLVDGSNTTDAGLLVHVEQNAVSESEQQVAANLTVLSSDAKAKINAVGSVQNAGTPDFLGYLKLGVDLGMSEGDLVAIEVATKYAEAVEPISLEGLTVIDLANMTEEEQNALMGELMGTGLSTVLGNAMQAMPEQVGAIMQMLQGDAEGETEGEGVSVQ